jgi:flagellar biogenesis protein FliO
LCAAAALLGVTGAAVEEPRNRDALDRFRVPADAAAAARPTDDALADDDAVPADDVPPTSAAADRAVPLARRQAPPLPLARPGAGRERSAASHAVGAMGTTLGSLAAVLGLFFLVAWGLRRRMPAGAGALPAEVVEVLGLAPLPGKQQAHLVRCGRKLLLVHVTNTGVETLTEITDPAEVDRLEGLCRESRPHSATVAFRQALADFAREPAPGGFLGAELRSGAAPREGRRA